MQEDEDPYASVDDDDKEEDRKSDGIRLKVQTLDIKEGSGDSTFYAKVCLEMRFLRVSLSSRRLEGFCIGVLQKMFCVSISRNTL